jgi:hypothetical protein
MSRYPSTTWKPIGGTSRRQVQKDLLCLHTAVGSGLGTWAYFNRVDVGVYSHFVVCGVWGSDAGKDVDGLALQMADTDYRAAANLDGNWRIISVETADNATRPIQPWTPAQCDTLVDLMVDANLIDGIPLVLVPDSRRGRRGICYHRQGCDPYRVAGGELWSSSPGKDCPTQARIDQIPGLIDRARAVVAGGGEDDMSAADVAAINKHTDEKIAEIYGLLGYGDQRVDTGPDTHPYNLQNLVGKVDKLQASVDQVLVNTTPPPPAEPSA